MPHAMHGRHWTTPSTPSMAQITMLSPPAVNNGFEEQQGIAAKTENVKQGARWQSFGRAFKSYYNDRAPPKPNTLQQTLKGVNELYHTARLRAAGALTWSGLLWQNQEQPRAQRGPRNKRNLHYYTDTQPPPQTPPGPEGALG
ncbi:hypothetical protein NDU88_004511 [Pleurodeles waltl]|uniref:Uncharacterized protein n=1 Tax=Pleurodeles waltl TaxID=8319 RepID=A0AAV7PFF0_PLEWA|nr:hypothetical protein NDU88_004511 [Pleurodeles waltl]